MRRGIVVVSLTLRRRDHRCHPRHPCVGIRGAGATGDSAGRRAAGPPCRSPRPSRCHGADGGCRTPGPAGAWARSAAGAADQQPDSAAGRSASHARGGAQANYDHLRQAGRDARQTLRNPAADGPPVEQLKDRAGVDCTGDGEAQTTLQRAIADEAAMASELATEQARWTDLNQRMEALEAALGPR